MTSALNLTIFRNPDLDDYFFSYVTKIHRNSYYKQKVIFTHNTHNTRTYTLTHTHMHTANAVT